MLNIILHITILALFTLGAILQLQHEQAIYKQKHIDGPVYVSLERKRKKFRNYMYAIFYATGVASTVIGLRSAPTLFAGMVIYWILFDGLFATKVQHKNFWHVGITSKIDAGIKTEKKSKLLKLSAAALAVAGIILNNIL